MELVIYMKRPYYGDILGSNNGVIAYANRGYKDFKLDSNEVYGVYTGFKYQCVEYARRWLVISKNLTFPEVLIATDIWGVPFLTDISTNQEVPLTPIPNNSPTRPKIGDLLVYQNGSKLPWGHVAVIVNIKNQESIQIAEQNEIDHFWTGDFSRELKLTYSENYKILDKYPIIGWMTYNR